LLCRREFEGLKAATARGVSFVSVAAQLCRKDVCPASIDGVFLYRDADHLSIEGSRWIGEHTSVLKLAPAPPQP
jgi:SGNH domain (fused to AT3 domains)